MLTKPAIKLPFAAPLEDLEPFSHVFHRWIQDDVIPGMPLDVADYTHVPRGPSIILIGHEADHVIDQSEGPIGLVYNRKRRLEGTDEERLSACLGRLVIAARLLVSAPELGGTLAFAGDRLRLVFNDRLAHPNDDAGFAALAPVVEQVLAQAWGTAPQLARDTEDPRHRLTVHARFAAPVGLDEIAERLAVSAAT